MNLNSYFKEIQQFLLSEEVKKLSSEEIEQKITQLTTLRTTFKTFIESLKKAKIKFEDVKNAAKDLYKNDNLITSSEAQGEVKPVATPDSNGTPAVISDKPGDTSGESNNKPTDAQDKAK